METFEAKVRQVGSSLGVLIPKDITKKDKIKKGETIRITVVKKNFRLIEKAFGAYPDLPSFKRDRDDREF
ncbi:MAG: hypothetical protein AABW99_03655 [archaeon]